MANIKQFSNPDELEKQNIRSQFEDVYHLVFRETFSQDYTERLFSRDNLIFLASFDKDTLIGFKAGYTLPEAPSTLYSWIGGVHPEFRRRGVAWDLMVEQHKLAAHIGLQAVETKCQPKWAGMMALNYKAGFKLIKEYIGKKSGEKKYLLRKSLV